MGGVAVAAFVEVPVDVEDGLDARVSQAGGDDGRGAPWAMRRATWLWRRSWNRMGWATESATAGSQKRLRNVLRRMGPPSGAVKIRPSTGTQSTRPYRHFEGGLFSTVWRLVLFG